ncbi:MAG: glutathione S-transferase family protein [Myxococcales bacterium]|nr:glutathione S-transferase family protein [Myxococcales bacterium]
MSRPTIIGFPQSSFVWSARAGLHIKQIEYDFEPLAPGDHRKAEFTARHPFAKVPLMSLGGVDIFETSAILRWADSQPGPPLFPEDPVAHAQVEQWVSVVQSYLYPWIVPGYFFVYPRDGSEPDRAVIDAIVPKIANAISALEERMDDGPWVVGSDVTAADILLGPLLFLLNRMPEGKGIMAANPKATRLLGALMEHEGFMAGAPAR